MTSSDVYCTTAELAAELHIDPSTLRRWVESGTVKPAFTTPGGHHRFDRADALRQIKGVEVETHDSESEAVAS
jgi:excisionase family DNA binding protein